MQSINNFKLYPIKFVHKTVLSILVMQDSQLTLRLNVENVNELPTLFTFEKTTWIFNLWHMHVALESRGILNHSTVHFSSSQTYIKLTGIPLNHFLNLEWVQVVPNL